MKMMMKSKPFLSIVLSVVILCGILMTPGSVRAGSFIIVSAAPLNSTDGPVINDGICTLREAIISANENQPVGGCAAGSAGGQDVIMIPSGFVYLFQNGDSENSARTGDLDITESVRIIGAGKTWTIIDAQDLSDRVFHIYNDQPASKIVNVYISGVTIRYANLSGLGTAGWGGGIFNDHGNLEVWNSLITENHAENNGGGIANAAGGTLLVSDTSLILNTAQKNGGGIFNKGRATVQNTLLFSNQANFRGGGIDTNSSQSDFIKLINVTLTSNTAPLNMGGGMFGDAPISILNSTFVGNPGGGLASSGSGSYRNTIFAQRTAAGKNCSFDYPQSFVSAGHNLEDHDDCGMHAVGDQVNTDPKLQDLSDQGGSSQVFALVEDSPAVDAGDNNVCPKNDQRGIYFLRPGGAGCDIGAFEYDAKVIVFRVYLSAIRHP